MPDDDELELDANAGSFELLSATTSINMAMGKLARAFPSAIAIVAIDSGEVSSLFVAVRSRQFQHMNPTSPHQMRKLAQIVGRIDPQLRREFESALAAVPWDTEP